LARIPLKPISAAWIAVFSAIVLGLPTTVGVCGFVTIDTGQVSDALYAPSAGLEIDQPRRSLKQVHPALARNA
jgi:hypothetical protein